LDRGAKAKLTLVSAPTGFGKTSLVSQWLSSRTSQDRTVVWIALDPTDDQPVAFWAQVLTALQAAALPAIGKSILPLLESGQPPTEGVLAVVVNELSALPDGLDLVLDDYHVIDDPAVHEGMTFLLDHLPPRVHVLITTRADPPLPMARLRARGEMVEIRAEDLRFTAEEASIYLNEAMGLGLGPEHVAALEERTEGWIAALQLAALSMEGRDNIADFVAQFTGNDRYIVDYLVEEVLQRLPDEIRMFLLDTCILERLNGPLCNAVAGRSDGKAMLGVLERRNLFVVPLDDQRRWYRYHHLFADVLQAHLEDEEPGRAPELHGRASEWYEREGEWTEAIRHALAAHDFERAAELVERAFPAIRVARQETALRRWVEALPDALVRRRPVLNVGYAGALLLLGELSGVEGRLDDAEHQLTPRTGDDRTASSARMVEIAFVDEGELRHVPGQAEIYRAAIAQVRGDVRATVEHARRAKEIAVEDDHLVLSGAAGFLGIALWTRGDLEAAHRAWSECVAELELAGNIADALGATLALGDICIVQGRLGEALHTYEDALALVPEQNRALVRGPADMHVGMSEIFRERNDLEAARRHLIESQELGELATMPQHPYRWRVAMARLRQAEGGAEEALALLEDAERVYVSDFFPNVRPLAALQARMWIALGSLREAGGWARKARLSPNDELSYLSEFEHITLARLLLAVAKTNNGMKSRADAVGLLSRLREAAETGARTGSVIEILVLEALAAADDGDRAAALVVLEQALTAAEPEGYARLFVDEGLVMKALLGEASRRGIFTDYISELLAAFEPPSHYPVRTQGLVEALSDRELEVLRLLASELSGPDIARELMVSLNTMRTHTKSIYMKLGVNNRRAAVRRGQELSLLSGPR
jgi:LuxR family maltose regulon positive regulatory protein